MSDEIDGNELFWSVVEQGPGETSAPGGDDDDPIPVCVHHHVEVHLPAMSFWRVVGAIGFGVAWGLLLLEATQLAGRLLGLWLFGRTG